MLCYKTSNTKATHRCHFTPGHACVDVNPSCNFFQTTKQSTESPIFDASFWSENVVSCPQCGHERNKIGDSVLCYKASNPKATHRCHIMHLMRVFVEQGDMQLKRNTTCEKRWKKMQQHRFRTKINYNLSPWPLATYSVHVSTQIWVM